MAELKKTLINKANHVKKRHAPGKVHKPNSHEIKNQTIKDLIFVMSEVANYLKQGDPLN